MIKRSSLLAFALVPLVLRSGEPAATPGPSPQSEIATAVRTEPAAAKRIQNGADTFELVSSTSTGTVDTEEYVILGEKLSDWSELVTVQRIKTGHVAGADKFLSFFEQRVKEDGASFHVLQQNAMAGVFAVQFPKSARNDEQVVIGLALQNNREPAVLNIVQYAIKPAGRQVDATQGKIKQWRDRLLQQATLVAATDEKKN